MISKFCGALAAFLAGNIILVGFATSSLAQQPPAIQYSVDLADAKNHYITVEMTVDTTGDQTELMMAVWTPGSYLVREYARHIDSMRVMNGKGEPLAYEKTRKNRWTVETKDVETFKVSYRLYCNEMSVRTNWVGREFAMLNGGPTFLTIPDRLDQPHEVRLKLPRNWSRSATSLKAIGDSANEYVAESFDELVDSPIVAGNISVYPFEVGGIAHQLVNVGDSIFWDGGKAAKDLAKVVAAHQEMWGNVPYDRYLFLNVIAGGGGGLEHDNSTVMMTNRWTFRDESRYLSWLSLASHEFFHTWNVRRLRPQGLKKYDYENETYTRSLWVAEGITSYYEDLLLVRGGLMTKKEYLSQLNSKIKSVQNTPGRFKQSLTESSYDTWIKFYRSDENSSNTRISYYSKGAVVGFLLDTRIREVTGGLKSLDDVMQLLYERHLESGYKPSDFRAIVSEVAGKDMSDWFKSAVDSTDELDFDSVSTWFGLEFPGRELEKKKDAPTGESKPTTEDSSKEKANAGEPWLGFTGTSRVSRVVADSPATEAGVNTGDEIIAINNYRISSSISSVLKQFEIGDELNLMIARRGKIEILKIRVGSKVDLNWNLRVSKSQTVEQKANFYEWLGLELPEPSAAEESAAGEASAEPSEETDGE